MPLPPELRIPVPVIETASCKAHEGEVMATFTCLCQPGNAPILLRSVMMTASCQFCRRSYKITGASFDERAGKPLNVTVSEVIVRQPPQQ